MYSSKKIIVTFIYIIFCPNIFSQNLGSFLGKVSEKNGAVEFANIIVTSTKDTTKLIKSTFTDSTGHFLIIELPPDNYILKIQMIGYLQKRFILQIDSVNKSADLNTIQLIADSKILNSVDVVTHRHLIKKTMNGFIINAKDNLTLIGGTATDLLRSTPTVVVDAEGVITIRGKSPLILINGRNSSLSSTDRIPASSIESIEIINNPTAQYDADAEGGIINIKLKKNIGKGTNGSAALGGGYGAFGRINSSFIINHSNGKWNIGVAYDNRFASRTRNIEASRTNFYLPNEYNLSQIRFDNRFEQTQNAKLNIDFNPNEKKSFNLEVLGNMDGQDNDETLASMFSTQTNIFNTKNSRRSIEIGREKVLEPAFTYTRKFNDSRKSLVLNASSSFNYEAENTDITTQSLAADDSHIGNALQQRTHNYQNSSVSNLKIDYTHPIGKKGILETGYKGIVRYTDADFQSSYNENGIYVVNPLVSNNFIFQEQVHAAYLQFRSYIGKIDSAKWKYDIGLRAEQVYNQGRATGSVSFNRDYFNLFPMANLAYFINPGDFIKVSFSRRINRPGLGALNPFIDITDSLNQHGGNPNLKPELINSAELGYNKEWKKISLSGTFFYRYATNIIRGYITLKSGGVALNSPTNFGNATTYGLEGIISVFPAKFWSFNASFSIYQQNIDGSNVSSDVANNLLSWYGKLINNFSLWKGSKLQLIGNYNSPIATPQGYKVAVYNVDMGFSQQILNGKGRLGLVITDIFNTQRNGQTAYTYDFSWSRISKIDTRAVLITFAYTFGTSFKESLLENKFSNE